MTLVYLILNVSCIHSAASSRRKANTEKFYNLLLTFIFNWLIFLQSKKPLIILNISKFSTKFLLHLIYYQTLYSLNESMPLLSNVEYPTHRWTVMTCTLFRSETASKCHARISALHQMLLVNDSKKINRDSLKTIVNVQSVTMWCWRCNKNKNKIFPQ